MPLASKQLFIIIIIIIIIHRLRPNRPARSLQPFDLAFPSNPNIFLLITSATPNGKA